MTTLTWVQTQTNWAFVMRTASKLLIHDGAGGQPIGEAPVTHGRLRLLPDIALTQHAALPANLVVWWGQEYGAPLFLITNFPTASRAAWFYRRRFRLETFFSDQKSRGFHIHQSHLSDPARLRRLLSAACLAYVWMTVLKIADFHTLWCPTDMTSPLQRVLF